MILPQEYIVQKFYQYAGYPKYKKLSHLHEACCPICREGKSWGKKKRCYYLLDDNAICCHNCGWYSNPLTWIEHVSGQTKDEILKESTSFDILPLDLMYEQPKPVVSSENIHTLPQDSINLFDIAQVEFYKENPIVQKALEVIKQRRLNTAVNRPDTLWLSLTDKIHKNRLIIPFYNDEGNIIFYQSRTLLKKDLFNRPKYLGKLNGERSLFNLNKVDSNLEYVFIFEGPIDAFFVKNGIAVAGIQEKSSKTFTQLQEQQIASYKLFKKVWVLDSQWLDRASYSKTERLIEEGESVFIWPEQFGRRFKDINELCVYAQKDTIKPRFFIENSYNDLKARLILSAIDR